MSTESLGYEGDDFRILSTLRFAAPAGGDGGSPESLEIASWFVVDAFRAAGLYAVVSTFPGSTDPDPGGDFGLVHRFVPVNRLDVLCVHVQPSPVRESFSDPRELATADAERSAFATAMRRIAHHASFVEGSLWLSCGGCPPPMARRDFEGSLRTFCRNLERHRADELGVVFERPA